MTEVTIIGSGIAAVAAAITARERGDEVTLCKGHPGATSLFSGAWDIAGDPFRHPHQPWDESPSPLQNLQKLMIRNPYHPYHFIPQEDPGQFLQEAVERLSKALGYRLSGSLQEAFAALTPIGTLKMTSFVSQGTSAGNFLKLRDAKLLLVGFKGLPGFSMPRSAAVLREVAKRGKIPFTVDAVELFPELNFTSPFELAHRLDGDWQETFYQTVAGLVKERHPSHLVLPPVMGIEKSSHLLARLYEVTGIHCFETLALPPSVPGLRLQNAIDRYLSDSCRIVPGKVDKAILADGNVKGLQCTHEGKTTLLEVKNVILATGKFIGGGLLKEESFSEPLFNLPIFCEERRVEKIFVGKVVERNFLSQHPLFSVGVKANASLQAVNERDEVLYDNLWVAGSLLRGYDPTTDHSGMGTAIATGTLAGRRASERRASERQASERQASERPAS